MTIPLQTGYVYGPVVSRRFGSSLGINILPTDEKVCNFDCVYCQYGASVKEEDFSFPPAEEIKESAEKHVLWMQGQSVSVDWIMIAGNGEPTLHPKFSRIVDDLKRLRDTYLPGVKLGILSNASSCFKPEIQNALSKLDRCFMKLDAGYHSLFRRLNAPQGSSDQANLIWSDIIDGLYHLPKGVIQRLFVTGKEDNTDPTDVQEWERAVDYIHPEEVQIYTVDRPTRVEGILPVEKQKLDEIAKRLTSTTGIPAHVSV